MSILHLLKKLKQIEPDPSYTARSRATILAGFPRRFALPAPWELFSRFVQSGTAFAMVVVFLLVAAGGFSTWKFLSPLKLSGLDPETIRVEAQAIDIQIQLTDVSYPESTAPTAISETPPEKQHAASVKKLAEHLGVEPPSTTSSEPMTIDEALDKLAE